MRKNLIVLTIISISLLAACKSSKNANEQPVPTIISAITNTDVSVNEPSKVVRFAVREHEMGIYDSLIDIFTADHPNIAIRLVAISDILGDEISNNGSQTLRMAQQVDVFPSFYAYRANWQSLTLDLTPFIANTSQFQQADFYLNSLQEPDGSVRTIPISLNFALIYYNKDIFDAAGMAYPQSGWTWDEFSSAAERLTVGNGDNVSQWGLANAFPFPSSFIGSQFPDGWLNYDTSPSVPRFEEATFIEATRRYTDLYLQHVSPDFNDPNAHNVQAELIRSGNVAMWMGGFDAFAEYDQTLNIDVALFPIFVANENTTMVQVDGVSMSAGSANPEAAWEWMLFLAQHPLGQGVPARASIAESSGFWQGVPPPLEPTMRNALTHSYIFKLNILSLPLSNAVRAVLNEEETVEAALANAQAEAMALLMNDGELPDIAVADSGSNDEASVAEIAFLSSAQYLESMRLLARQFEDETGIRVQVRSRWEDSPQGEPPPITVSEMAQKSDCFQAEPIGNDGDVLNSVLSLTPFIEADETFDLADFYPALVGQFMVQGQLWALPAEYDPMLIEYNQDLFDAADVPYPKLGWTMDDFLQTAVSLTHGEDETKQYGFVPNLDEFNVMQQFLAQHGAILIDSSSDPATVNFTDPSVINAVNWYADLSSEYGVKPVFFLDITDTEAAEASMVYFEERTRLISSGLAAMWVRFGSSTNGRSFDDSRTLSRVGVAPLPVTQGVNPDNRLAGVTGYYISAGTNNRQACWAWLNFLTQSVSVTIGMPPRQSVVESEAYFQFAGKALALTQQNSVEQLGSSTSSFATAEWAGFSLLWLGHAVSQTHLVDITATEALSTAQQTFDAYLTCLIEKDGFDNFELQKQCMVEVDPALSWMFGPVGE